MLLQPLEIIETIRDFRIIKNLPMFRDPLANALPVVAQTWWRRFSFVDLGQQRLQWADTVPVFWVLDGAFQQFSAAAASAKAGGTSWWWDPWWKKDSNSWFELVRKRIEAWCYSMNQLADWSECVSFFPAVPQQFAESSVVALTLDKRDTTFLVFAEVRQKGPCVYGLLLLQPISVFHGFLSLLNSQDKLQCLIAGLAACKSLWGIGWHIKTQSRALAR